MIIIIGILLGAFTGWGFLTIADRHSRALLVTTSTFGALGLSLPTSYLVGDLQFGGFLSYRY